VKLGFDDDAIDQAPKGFELGRTGNNALGSFTELERPAVRAIRIESPLGRL
jgi:hypothetical protein